MQPHPPCLRHALHGGGALRSARASAAHKPVLGGVGLLLDAGITDGYPVLCLRALASAHATARAANRCVRPAHAPPPSQSRAFRHLGHNFHGIRKVCQLRHSVSHRGYDRRGIRVLVHCVAVGDLPSHVLVALPVPGAAVSERHDRPLRCCTIRCYSGSVVCRETSKVLRGCSSASGKSCSGESDLSVTPVCFSTIQEHAAGAPNVTVAQNFGRGVRANKSPHTRSRLTTILPKYLLICIQCL
jgi:hypothetical protein